MPKFETTCPPLFKFKHCANSFWLNTFARYSSREFLSLKSLDKNSGFSLVELLIVLALFVMLSTGAVATYRAFYQRQQVLQSAKTLQDAMRLAQKKARVGEKPTGCVTLNGYIVSGTTNSTTITLSADCTDADYVVTTANLVGNARLVSNLNMTFRVIAGGVLNPGTVQLRYNTYTYAFDVNVGGEITEGDYE